MRTRQPYPLFRTTARLMRQMGSWNRLFLPGVGITSVVQLGLALLLAGFYGDAAAAILAGTTTGGLALLALAYGVPLVGILSLSAAGHYLTRTAVALASADLRSRVIRHLLAQPLDAALADHSGIKTSLLVNDVPTAMDCLNRVMSRPLEGLIRGIGSFVYVVLVDWRVALAALGIAVLGLLYSVPFAFAMRRAGDRVQEAMALSTARLKDLLGGVVTARVYGMGESMRAGFDRQVDIARHEGLKRARLSALLAMFNNGFFGLGSLALLVVAGLLTIGGGHDAPTFIRLVQMTPGIIGMFSISRSLSELMGSLSGATRVFAVLDRPIERVSSVAGATDETAKVTSAKAEATFATTNASATAETAKVTSAKADPTSVPGAPVIRFDDVWFGYDPQRPILRGVTFEIEEGGMTAIVGESGNGKSTLLRMLLGMVEPVAGVVEFHGVPTGQWPLSTLRDHMALVPQEAGLVSGSIRDNIALGRENATDDEIQRAAQRAGADRFIRRLPQGYDTQTGERGASLSGGQRQRLAIARALVKDAPILLLDEATSALDARTEHDVRQAIRDLRGGRTLVVVAHRLSTVRDADRILVLRGGRIVEQGKHDELLRLGGEYARLYTGQQAGVEEPAT